MQFTGLAVTAALLALVVLWLGARTLWQGPWLLAWLRGCLGAGLLAAAVILGLLGYDFSTYQERLSGQQVAVVSIRTANNGLFQVTLIEGQQSRQFMLEGEQWGLDARVLEWRGVTQLIGLQPGYRLASMQGRYLAMEQQLMSRYPEQQLKQSLLGLDIWQLVHDWARHNPLLEARRESVHYMALHDGARYELSWLPTGLQARPLNDVAEQELEHWVE